MSLNFCWNRGSLVDAGRPVPDDVGDYYAHPSFDLIGCNRLYCQRCDEYVRSAPGLGFALPNMLVDLGKLYEREDLAGAPEIIATYPGRRLYLCRCSRWLEAFTRPVRVDEPDPLTDPTMPWECAGHPPVIFATEVDGEYIGHETDVRSLAQRALEGFAGPAARPKDAAAWTARLYARLCGTSAAEIVAQAAADRLADPDPAVRARAIRFFAVFPLPIGVVRIVDQIESGGSGDEAQWSVAAQFIDKNERVRALARAEVVSPGRGKPIHGEMMQSDGAWVVEHVEEIARGNPQLVGDLLDAAWRHHDDPRAVVRRVAAMHEVAPEVLEAFADRQSLRVADREWLAAQVAGRARWS